MPNRAARSLSTSVGGCVLLLALVSPMSPSTAAGPGDAVQAKPIQALRQLEAARARWRARPIPYYRLRVETNNPLIITVTESDVRNGEVVVARGSIGMPGIGPKPGSGHWGPSEGQTVEDLFQSIERALHSPMDVFASYDPRRGFPTAIYTQASPPAMDGNVSYTITLTVSPSKPLVAPSPGQPFLSPMPARLVDPGAVYDSLLGARDVSPLVRRVWPVRADEIISRGNSRYWHSVGWKPQAGLVGNIIGTLTLPGGFAACVLEFQHDGQSLFLLAEKPAVQAVRFK